MSIQALSGSKSAAADPSASKESATGQPASHGTQPPVHQRLQSRTIPEPVLRSMEKPDQTESRRGREGERRDLAARPKEVAAPEPSGPVQVPSVPERGSSQRDQYPHVPPSGPSFNTYYGEATHLRHPPRLPLPIGDATTAPGSPIMGLADSQGVVVARDKDQDLSGDKSVLDETTMDEDEIVDELQPYDMTGLNKAVPTTIEWRGAAEKVYVTGTFVNWERKFRLHKRYVESFFPIWFNSRLGLCRFIPGREPWPATETCPT